MARPVYHIEVDLPNGQKATYEVEAANDEQADKIGKYIHARIAAGDPELKGGDHPVPLVVDNGPANAPETSSAGAFARGVGKGGTFNWFDELSAFGNAASPSLASLDNFIDGGHQIPYQADPGGFWHAYNRNLQEIRGLQAADETQHPLASGAGTAVGTVATINPIERTAGLVGNAAVRLAPRAAIPLAARMSAAAIGAPIRTAIAESTAIGGGAGTVAGAGAGDTPASRGKSAALGGAGGAAGGAVISGTLTGFGPAVARYWNMLRGHNTEAEAVSQIVRALNRDGYDVSSPAGTLALKQELSRFTNKPVSLADIGSSIRARAGVGLRAPSGEQQHSIDTIMARSQGQGARLARDVRANVAPRTDVHALDEALVDQRAAEAARLRDRALFVDGPASPRLNVRQVEEPMSDGRTEYYVHDPKSNVRGSLLVSPDGVGEINISGSGPGAAGVGDIRRMMGELRGEIPNLRVIKGERSSGARADLPEGYSGKIQKVEMGSVPAIIPASGRQSRVVDDPQLQQLARLPDAQAALQAAVKRAEAERLLLSVKGESIDHIPDIHPGADLDVRTFDYLKRHLDDEVNALYRGADTQTFKAGQAHQVKQLRDAIRDRLRQAVPEYGEYLDAYSGSSDMLDALRTGRDYRKLDPEVIASEQGDRSDAGKELYRVGVARDLLDTIDATPSNANAASRILRSPEEEAQLAATGANVPPLRTSVHQERQLNLLPAELSGAQTAGRLAAEADANHSMDLMIPFNPTSGRGWLGAVARMAGRHLSTTRNAAVNEALLPRVLATNPAAIDGVIAELEASGQKASADALRRLKNSRRGSGVFGMTIGAPVALPEGDRE